MIELRSNSFILFHIALSSFLLLTIYLFKSIQLYIICVILITILWSIYKLKSIKLIFISSLILFFTLRLIFFVGTQFRILAFGDTYWDFAVVRTFLDNKEIFTISDSVGGVSTLEAYSTWPLLHIFEYIFITITNINPLLAHILNSLYIPTIPFIITFLIIKLLHIRLALPIEFVYIASAFYVTMPEMIFWSIQVIRNTIAWVFISIVIFLILRDNKRPSHSSTIVILLLFIGIVISHHWSALIIASVLLLYLFSINMKFNKNNQFSTNTNRNLYFIYALFLIIILIIWWLYYANIIFEIVNFNKALSIKIRTERWTPPFPPELTPIPLISLLRVKTFLIYIPIIIGSYFIYKYYREFSIIRVIFPFYVIIILLLLLNFIINLEPTRIIMVFIPFFLISLSLFYIYMYNRNKALKLTISYAIIPLIIITSFIGIFSHNIVPLHLYSNIVNPLTIGEHSTNIYISEFLKKIDYSNIINIFTDDYALTSLIPSSQLHKIELLQTKITSENPSYYNPSRLIVIMKDFFSYRYYAGGFSYTISYHDALILKEEMKKDIKANNLLYTDGYSFIYQ
ncbi:MAG: hypothetical protein QW416_09305 [Candidatus Nitrosocaldaceae archaeon]